MEEKRQQRKRKAKTKIKKLARKKKEKMEKKMELLKAGVVQDDEMEVVIQDMRRGNMGGFHRNPKNYNRKKLKKNLRKYLQDPDNDN